MTPNPLDNWTWLSDEHLKSWIAHDKLGRCLGLGLFRRNYLKYLSKLPGIVILSKLVDYGSSTEKHTGSCYGYNKNPVSTSLLWNGFGRWGLITSIIDRVLQLQAQ